ncbi:MAG: hypothetical protein LBG60_06380 [Bifidobacteriaceae bacterium]|nr:hypothetical protein [Bifidobacteriaceae bacterium]
MAAAALAVPLLAAPGWGAGGEGLEPFYQTDFATFDDGVTPFAQGPLNGQDGWVNPGAQAQVGVSGATLAAVSDGAAL